MAYADTPQYSYVGFESLFTGEITVFSVIALTVESRENSTNPHKIEKNEENIGKLLAGSNLAR